MQDMQKVSQSSNRSMLKKVTPSCHYCRNEWQRFSIDVTAAERASMMAEKGFAFAFVEGALVRAVREGWWLLLDEINLAPAEVRCDTFTSLILIAHD